MISPVYNPPTFLFRVRGSVLSPSFDKVGFGEVEV